MHPRAARNQEEADGRWTRLPLIDPPGATHVPRAEGGLFSAQSKDSNATTALMSEPIRKIDLMPIQAAEATGHEV
jgi:hypothetical protein